MNTAEITNILPATHIEPMTVGGMSVGQQDTTRTNWQPVLRHALFGVTVVLLLVLAFTLHNWVNDVEAQIDAINAMLGPAY